MLLILHIGGAVVTLIVLILAAIELTQPVGRYRRYIKAIAGVTVWQIASGSALVVASPGINMGKVCMSALAYLAAVGGMGTLLVCRLKSAGAKA